MFRTALRQSLISTKRFYSTGANQQLRSNYTKNFILVAGITTTAALSFYSISHLSNDSKSSKVALEAKAEKSTEVKPEQEQEQKPAPQGEEQPAKEGEEGPQAYDPETGEINWDCPCLGGMAHGPCGEEFKAAFSCFVYSKEEPKGIECIEKFKAMQNCFREHPDVYSEELRDDEEYNANDKESAELQKSIEQKELTAKIDREIEEAKKELEEKKAELAQKLEELQKEEEKLAEKFKNNHK
ncbi:unnamed protein product [Ambrosiozyma monospora]|uniref:Mitochondrial intermembrane space import and assembly protein 40 n=1 Tax=Ambrosiozyma monospora TaxID=43982 RepID=A0A9W6YTX2_AMBMO|nr:unnamed protein product [Ambrosiozyma monospora]